MGSVARTLPLRGYSYCMSDSQPAEGAFAQHRARCAVCRAGARCSDGGELRKAWLRAQADKHRTPVRLFGYWTRDALDRCKDWFCKRELWEEELLDGSERRYLEPSRSERAKEWIKAFGQFVLALFV